MGRRLGLIVGVNSYQDTQFQPLQYAENDARALSQWLVNEKGGKWNPADVQHVFGAYATKGLIESLIQQLCITFAQPGDLVLIYIASNAFLSESNGDGYLALADTFYHKPDTGIRLSTLMQQVMTQSRATNILFMFDAFQDGQGWNERQNSPYDMQPLLGTGLLNGLQQLQNRVILCSCRGNSFSQETSERGLGQFMYRLIIGLSSDMATAQTENISLQSLYTYLTNNLSLQQRPQVFGQAPTPIVLVGNTPPPQLPTLPQTPPQESTPIYTPGFPQSPQVSPAPQNAAMAQSPHVATATAHLTPSAQSQRTTSGQVNYAQVEQHRQQQSASLLEQARTQLQGQNSEGALQLTNQALQILPGMSAGLTLKAQVLGTLGRFAEAQSVVAQLLQQEPDNPLAWSMNAVVLTNTGHHQEALTAIERSLELDASNMESYAIKTNIMSSIAIAQNRDKTLPKNELIASDKRRGGPLSFVLGAGVQIVGLVLGIIGGLLPVLRPGLPMLISFLLESVGLALLCVNAVRGSYLNGILRVLMTIFIGLIPLGVLGISIGYRPLYRKIIFALQDHTSLLVPFLFFVAWLAVAGTLPILLAIIGYIAGLISGVRRRK